MPTIIDPQLFRPEAIDVETAAFLAEVDARRGGTPPPDTWDLARMRADDEAGRGRGFRPVVSALASDRTVPGPAGGVRLHILTPDTVHGVYLFMRGGGFVFGRAHYADQLLDDTLFMYARWLAAGNPAELTVYPGGPHGFVMGGQPAQLAERARAQAEASISQVVATGPSV